MWFVKGKMVVGDKAGVWTWWTCAKPLSLIQHAGTQKPATTEIHT